MLGMVAAGALNTNLKAIKMESDLLVQPQRTYCAFPSRRYLSVVEFLLAIEDYPRSLNVGC